MKCQSQSGSERGVWGVWGAGLGNSARSAALMWISGFRSGSRFMYCPSRVWVQLAPTFCCLACCPALCLVGSFGFSWFLVCPHVTKVCGVVCPRATGSGPSGPLSPTKTSCSQLNHAQPNKEAEARLWDTLLRTIQTYLSYISNCSDSKCVRNYETKLAVYSLRSFSCHFTTLWL